jgi:hypothetical protein
VDPTKHARPKRQSVAQGKDWYPGWLLEGQDSARANHRQYRAQDRNRIGKEHQYETTDNRIEELIDSNLVHVGFEKVHVAKSRGGYASLGSFNRSPIAFDSDYLSRRSNEPRNQHGNVSKPRSEIENTLTRPDTRLAEKALCSRSNQRGLPHQALVLRIRVAERIGIGRTPI